MRKTAFIGLFTAITLVACSTSPQQRLRDEQEREARAQAAQAYKQQKDEEWANGLRTQCLSYGFKPNTTEFSQCLMQVDQQKRAANAAWFAEQDRQREKLFQTARDLAKPPEFLKPPCPNTNSNGGSRPAGCQ
jgi:membrane-bound lytic murein transglycosylase